VGTGSRILSGRLALVCVISIAQVSVDGVGSV